MFICTFWAYFQNTYSYEHLCRAASNNINHNDDNKKNSWPDLPNHGNIPPVFCPARDKVDCDDKANIYNIEWPDCYHAFISKTDGNLNTRLADQSMFYHLRLIINLIFSDWQTYS